MSSRISDGTGGPQHLRKRRRNQCCERDAAINSAASDIQAAGNWPSPALVAKSTGISEAVVSRQKHLLAPARQAWVERFGPHPQWGVGDNPPSGDPRDARIEALERKVAHLAGRLDYAIAIIRKLRTMMPRLRREAREAAEERDAFLASIRPSAVQRLVTRNQSLELPADPGTVRYLKTRRSS